MAKNATTTTTNVPTTEQLLAMLAALQAENAQLKANVVPTKPELTLVTENAIEMASLRVRWYAERAKDIWTRLHKHGWDQISAAKRTARDKERKAAIDAISNATHVKVYSKDAAGNTVVTRREPTENDLKAALDMAEAVLAKHGW